MTATSVTSPCPRYTSGPKVSLPCPICGRQTDQELYPDRLGDQLPSFGYNFTLDSMRTYRIMLCPTCRHAYASPRHVGLCDQYESVEDQSYLERQRERLITAEKVLRRLQQHIPSGRLLDIGCATGDFLSVAKTVYDVEGVELSAWAAQIAETHSVTIHRRRLQELEPSQPYDLITLWGVIEHFEDPVTEVSNMRRLLREGGIVSVWTGDRDGFSARLLQQRWWYVIGQHIQLFSRTSLRRLFVEQGFEEIWVGRYPYVVSLGSIARSLKRYRGLGAMAGAILRVPGISQQCLTMSLPGEMFAIFRKQAHDG